MLTAQGCPDNLPGRPRGPRPGQPRRRDAAPRTPASSCQVKANEDQVLASKTAGRHTSAGADRWSEVRPPGKVLRCPALRLTQVSRRALRWYSVGVEAPSINYSVLRYSQHASLIFSVFQEPAWEGDMFGVSWSPVPSGAGQPWLTLPSTHTHPCGLIGGLSSHHWSCTSCLLEEGNLPGCPPHTHTPATVVAGSPAQKSGCRWDLHEPSDSRCFLLKQGRSPSPCSWLPVCFLLRFMYLQKS